jgi:hypothetical protein
MRSRTSRAPALRFSVTNLRPPASGFTRLLLKRRAHGFGFSRIRSARIIAAAVPFERPHFRNPVATYTCLENGDIRPT